MKVDFDNFRRVFARSYNNLIEELNRSVVRSEWEEPTIEIDLASLHPFIDSLHDDLGSLLAMIPIGGNSVDDVEIQCLQPVETEELESN